MSHELNALKTHLLSIAGTRFQLDWVLESEITLEFAAILFRQGRPIDGGGAKLWSGGRTRDCHASSARYAAAHPEFRHYSSFALSDDGCWRVHSWLLGPKGILETTTQKEP